MMILADTYVVSFDFLNDLLLMFAHIAEEAAEVQAKSLRSKKLNVVNNSSAGSHRAESIVNGEV